MLDVLRRCGLFYISTLVTITITRKEVVINFLMFKHNIFQLLVFLSFIRNVLYYTVVVVVSVMLLAKCGLNCFYTLVNTTSEQSIRGPEVVEPSWIRRHHRRTTDRPGRSGAA